MSNKKVNKPKKPMTPYMIFVREVRLIFFYIAITIIDKTKGCKGVT